MQRLRVTFGRGEATRYIAHLDLMRFWERAFRRAGLPVAVTQGFHPHQRFALAAPLPVGVTGQGELMDVFLEQRLDPETVRKALAAQMVPGVEVLAVHEATLEEPSLQAQMRFAEYLVTMETSLSQEAVAGVIATLLAKGELPWEHLRDGQPRRYNLRSQVDALWLEGWGEASPEQGRGGRAVLGMRLQADGGAAGRPEQVTRALGFEGPPVAILRTRLVLSLAPQKTPALTKGRSERTARERRPGPARAEDR